MSLRNDARSGIIIMAAIYVENKLFDHVVNVIATLEPCPFAGKVTIDQIKLALADATDVWPVSIAADARAWNREGHEMPRWTLTPVLNSSLDKAEQARNHAVLKLL
jgi:hypothetical protein